MSERSTSRRHQFLGIMDALDLTVNGWANLADVSEGTLRSFLKGTTRSLREETAAKLLSAAQDYATKNNLAFDQLNGEQSAKTTKRVWVKGFVGAGAVVQVLDSMGEDEGLYEVGLPPGVSDREDYVAYEIRGASMPPAQDGWIVFCVKRDAPDPSTIINQTCLVQLTDGHMMFKVVRRGYSENRYNLESWDGSPLIEDAELLKAMPVAGFVHPQFVAT